MNSDDGSEKLLNSPVFLLSSVLPTLLILSILLNYFKLFQATIIDSLFKSGQWIHLFQEFISQEDIEGMSRQEARERETKERRADSNLMHGRGNRDALDYQSTLNNPVFNLNDESSPLLGRARKGTATSSSPSVSFGLVAIPVVELSGWIFSIAYRIMEPQNGIVSWRSASALLIWVSCDFWLVIKLGKLG